MYKVYISGHGAELTQGTLPIDTVLEINESLETHDIELSRYIIDSTFADDHFDWYEIDDNFHCTGAYLDSSFITVEDEAGNEIYKEECCNLNVSNCDYTEELYPEDSKVGAIGVLTCLDVQKGTFTQGTINLKEFDPKLLSITVRSLGDYDLIDSIHYNGSEVDDIDLGDTTSKNFIAYIEE
jgi:hypothetical protein